MLISLNERQKQIALIVLIAVIIIAGIYFYQKRMRDLASTPGDTSETNNVSPETIKKLTAPQDISPPPKTLQNLSAPKAGSPPSDEILNSLTAPSGQ